MGGKDTEACGRCAMTTVVDAAGSDEEREDRNPFNEGAIEVDERSLRAVSPAAWLERVTGRLDAAVQRLVYGR